MYGGASEKQIVSAGAAVVYEFANCIVTTGLYPTAALPLFENGYIPIFKCADYIRRGKQRETAIFSAGFPPLRNARGRGKPLRRRSPECGMIGFSEAEAPLHLFNHQAIEKEGLNA